MYHYIHCSRFGKLRNFDSVRRTQRITPPPPPIHTHTHTHRYPNKRTRHASFVLASASPNAENSPSETARHGVLNVVDVLCRIRHFGPSFSCCSRNNLANAGTVCRCVQRSILVSYDVQVRYLCMSEPERFIDFREFEDSNSSKNIGNHNNKIAFV